mgnify:CR=1 FL=1|jgi:hypothetical protein
MISSGLCLFCFIVRGLGYPNPLTPRGPVQLAAANEAQSPQERKLTIRLLVAGLTLFLCYAGTLFIPLKSGLEFGVFSPYMPALFMLIFFCIWIPLCWWGGRRIKQIRIEGGTWVEAQPVTGPKPGRLGIAGVMLRFVGGTVAATVWIIIFGVRVQDWLGASVIAATSLLVCLIGLRVCLRRPETYFRALATTVSASGFLALVVMTWRLGVWTARFDPSSGATAWLLGTTNGTIISILLVNLAAWKRDANLRKHPEKAS